MSAAAPGEAPAGGEHRLGALNRRAILGRIEQGAIVVLPVASLEQHGDHLPVSTDALLVEEVSLRAARQAGSAPDILVAPPLWTGFSPHHIPFGATVSLPAQTFLTLVGDVVAALRLWAPRVMIVNGHGGNRGPLITLALEAGCPLVSYWEPVATEIAALFPGDASIGHAGEAETGMMLAAFPQLVGEPAASFETPPDADLLLPDMGRSGVIGNPRAARAEAGEAFLALAAQGLLDHIELIFPTRRKGS